MASWPFRKIYLYLVCLIAILFMLFGIFGAINDFVNALYPSYYGPGPLDSYYSRQHEGNEDPIPEEIIAAQEEYYKEQRLNSQRRDMAQAAGRMVAVLFVALPVFLFHWRQTRPDD